MPNCFYLDFFIRPNYTSLQKNSKYAVFRSLFRRFLGIIQVARLAMCNIRKCSKSFIVFNNVNCFSIEQFQLFEIVLRKRPILYQVHLFAFWQITFDAYCKSLQTGQNIVDHILPIPKHYNMLYFG